MINPFEASKFRKKWGMGKAALQQKRQVTKSRELSPALFFGLFRNWLNHYHVMSGFLFEQIVEGN